MDAGIRSVEEGVARSRVAGEALEVIRSAASDASGQVSEIARATEEQARNSKHVATAAQRVSGHVQHISSAMAEQSQASENLLRNADLSLDMCRQMAQALEEQRSTGRYITSNSEAITEMIRKVQANTESHFHASSGVADRFTALLENAQRSCARIPEVSRLVADLARAAEAARAIAQSADEIAEPPQPDA
jgi:methyl-accepting chemotaxis protein